MVIANQVDKSTHLMTMEECRKKIQVCQRNIKMLEDMDAPEEQQLLVGAELAVWMRIMHHLNNGEIITINDKGEIQWIENKSQH